MALKDTAVGSDLHHLSAEMIITVGGIVTSLATVLVNYLLTEWTNIDVVSMSIWLVVPVGAAGGGLCAASGYYAAARLTQRMPSKRLLLNMVAVGLSTWVLIKWLPYWTMRLDDGRELSQVVPFSTYLSYTIEHAQLHIGTRTRPDAMTTGELGSLGYAREVLQVLGFMFGGFAMFGILAGSEACKGCQRYTKNTDLLVSVQPYTFDEFLQKVGISFPGFSEDAGKFLIARQFHGLSLSLHTCPSCSDTWACPAVVSSANGSNNSSTTKFRRYTVTADAAIALRAHAKAKKKAA